MLFGNENEFDVLSIGLASPDKIRYWSYGEVEKPETINYRTFKSERKGLFCERIFGPVKDWECACGKYRRIRYRGIICERCGVEVTNSKVRRERMGHIELATSVTHIWFLKGIPSYMGIILDMQARKLEEVVYYDSYIVIDFDENLEGIFEKNQIIPVSEYAEIKEKYKDKVTLDIGASALKKILKNLDLDKTSTHLKEELQDAKGQKRIKIAKRLRIIDALRASNNKPEWIVLDAIPIMPPDLRPMVQLDGGRFATSDLNDLYRRIINRNNRLKRLMDIGAPDMIIRNEKRMLQEAVDVLISNGKRGRAVTGSNGRPLKSLGNIIEGKQGRFRQNLLGKRVDYSARSVIVVGPHLKFNQCGLPKEICIELFKPHVIKELVSQGIVSNVKNAKRKIEDRSLEIWDILEKVIKGYPVLLNRAPTLHRLGIQSFEPIMVEGSAIQIHPLVCTAFNADFDGDQMAVHLPIGMEAKAECRFLVMSTNNILSPSSGSPIITPTQDMVLGSYYLTIDNPDEKRGENKFFNDFDEISKAYELDFLGLHSRVIIQENNERIKTTVGRIILNQAVRDVLDTHNLKYTTWINQTVSKKVLSDLIYEWYITYGNMVTAELADKLKDIGFKYATISGISIGVEDLKIPPEKNQILQDAKDKVEKLDNQVKKNIITSASKKARSNEIWRQATQDVSNALEQEMGALNNVFIMANSGARGNIDQVRQLAGMRGLMSDSQGRTVEVPIVSNFKEGLTLTEYFISCYGARKGLVDTALRTADSGYLTRRLVDVAQDVLILEEDCGTKEGAVLKSIFENGKELIPLADIIEGRVVLEDIVNPETKEVIVKSGQIVRRSDSRKISNLNITEVKARSVFKCQTKKGICQQCYGMDLATTQKINIGEAVGIIAAQSIGEPGTQLTMRTFHTGGVDLRKASKIEIKAKFKGKIKISPDNALQVIPGSKKSQLVAIKDCAVIIDEKHTIRIPENSEMLVSLGDTVNVGDSLATYDYSDRYIRSEREGLAKFISLDYSNESSDFVNNEGILTKATQIIIFDPNKVQTLRLDVKDAIKCKVGELVSAEVSSKLQNPIMMVTKVIFDEDKKSKTATLEFSDGVAYFLEKGTFMFCRDNQRVAQYEILAKTVMDDEEASKTQDIVQGLPRVEELFEARKNKNVAVLSEVDGHVTIERKENIQYVFIQNEDIVKEYKIPVGKRLLVFSGQAVKAGTQLTTGTVNPHDILETKGVEETQRYLSEQVLCVYKSQGVQINLKHIEIIVRQMTKKIIITDSGDSVFLPNEMVDIKKFDEVNLELENLGKVKASGKKELLGVTRSSLNTDSFIASSSFQQTAGVLTKAAIEGGIDNMYGLKENVIIGNLIPAGTGFEKKSKYSVKVKELKNQNQD